VGGGSVKPIVSGHSFGEAAKLASSDEDRRLASRFGGLIDRNVAHEIAVMVAGAWLLLRLQLARAGRCGADRRLTRRAIERQGLRLETQAFDERLVSCQHRRERGAECALVLLLEVTEPKAVRLHQPHPRAGCVGAVVAKRGRNSDRLRALLPQE